MNMNKLFLVIMAMAPLSAAAKISCAELDALDKGAEECKHNSRYVKAGEDCLKLLEAKIEESTGLSQKDIQEKADKALRKKKSEVTDKFEVKKGKKADLLADAKTAKDFVHNYRKNIFYPEDWDGPEELIGDREKFLNSQPCYAKARDSLHVTERIINYYIHMLR